MPITLKNRAALPKLDVEHIEVLGLSIPVTDSLPFGGQVELMDLQTKFEEGEIGQAEFLMRVFCLFTWRLPKREHVKYDWLARQTLEQEEVTELAAATMQLLDGFKPVTDDEGGEGKAPKSKRKAANSTS